jgi:hypothetical protein
MLDYMMMPSDASKGAGGGPPVPTAPPQVKIEAQFEVGEYEVVVLSATDSMALDTWLRAEKYNIPAGAKPMLKPYIESGMFFFVAKVNLKKVKREGGRAVLSPLRFHYDTDTFQLPVRLGLLNARGPQDLIIHILARNQRYEAANLPNATIPTNVEVKDEVKARFPEFYAALFDATLAKNPKAVVTEYSWDAGSCDPCPGPTLQGADFLTLGAALFPRRRQGAVQRRQPRPGRPDAGLLQAAGADGRVAHRPYSASALSALPATRAASAAWRNGSRSPSSTPSALPFSTLVRRSFTIL